MTAALASACCESTAANGELRQIAVPVLSLLMVAALTLSSLGPMLDHHFAERHPGHNHLYLGTALPDHSHSYQSSHSHYGAWMYVPADAGSPTGGIAIVMPNDGWGHVAADIAAPLVFHPLRLGGDDGGPLLKTSPDGDVALTGIIIAPSKRPPRA